LDRAAIESGASGRREAYKYVYLGDGYCANLYWALCQHRMACQRCDFYVPGESARVQALEANTYNQHLLEEIPMTEIKRKAIRDPNDMWNPPSLAKKTTQNLAVS
jgi:hypothetical protein